VSFRLAVSAELVFVDLPFLDRVRRIDELGFDVDIWDTGESNYPAVAAALDRLGYDGVVGLEGWASADPLDAVERFRPAFSVPGSAADPR